jgi:type VI secretion system VasD/TssJ family lipoprotein
MRAALKRMFVVALVGAAGLACSSPPGRKVCLDLVGSPDLNTFDGEPHAVVVRLYPLQEKQGFGKLTADELLDGAKPEGMLGNPYETTIVPGETREVRERFPVETLTMGIVADYYRAPGDRSGVRTMTVRAGCGTFSAKKIALGPRDLPKD